MHQQVQLNMHVQPRMHVHMMVSPFPAQRPQTEPLGLQVSTHRLENNSEFPKLCSSTFSLAM